jgi:Rrf2 family protein
MLDLALHYGQGPVLMRELSERQQISVKYLEQLIAPLKAEGLVKSTRGPHGGYHLAKEPSEITLCHIVRCLEGHTFLSECVEDPDLCERSGECVTHEVWTEVSSKIEQLLSEITLKEMAERQAKVAPSASFVYHI